MTETPIEKRIEAAQAELDRLKLAAEDADADANRCRIVFEKEPSAEAHTEAVVSAQKAKNAHQAVAQQVKAVQALETEKSDLESAENDRTFKAHLEKYDEAFNEATAAFCNAIEKLDHAIKVMADAPELYQSGQRVFRSVPSGYSLQQMVTEMNQKLASYHAAHEYDLSFRMATARTIGDLNHRAIRLEVIRNAGAVTPRFH